MKKILQLLFSSILMLLINSCKKAENKIFYEGGTPPAVTASTSSVRLEKGEETNTAIILNWTNPDYKFTTGLSSQDVSYTIEIDTLGANFGSSKKYTSVIAKDLSKVYTVGELNAILANNMVLQNDPRRDYTLQLRVTSSLGSNLKLTSNVISFTASPFVAGPKVDVPVNGTLWIVGNAVAGPPAWSNPVPPPYDVTQKFTKLSNTLYELTVSMAGGGEYKLIQIQGDWGTQYRAVTGGTWQAGDFEQKDANPGFPGPPVAGNYKITLDFQLGKYTVQ